MIPHTYVKPIFYIPNKVILSESLLWRCLRVADDEKLFRTLLFLPLYWLDVVHFIWLFVELMREFSFNERTYILDTLMQVYKNNIGSEELYFPLEKKHYN